MTIDDMCLQPENGHKPLEHLLREVFDLVDQYVDTITDDEVEDRLRRLLASDAPPAERAGSQTRVDEALDQATAIVAAARMQAEQIVAEARQQAGQIVAEAQRQAEQINTTAGYSGRAMQPTGGEDFADADEMLRKTFLEQQEGIPPLRVRIAKRPHVRCPTVSRTLARIESLGLMTVEDDRRLPLADHGRADAASTVRSGERGGSLAEQLVNVIGMTHEEAHHEASHWENVISDVLSPPTRSFGAAYVRR